MPATHVGDAWIFEIPETVFPVGSGPPLVLGTLPPDDYHATLTGEVQWQRPASGAVALNIQMDLDGYNSVTGELLPGAEDPGGFDSNLYPRLQQTDVESPGDSIEHWPFVDQSIMTVPTNCELRLDMRSIAPGYSAMLIKGRLVCTIISPQ